jgi:hypothetical protein
MSTHLAYVVISTPAPNQFMGGVMVTDGKGLPVAFRYTDPVTPTRIQQILYGPVLGQFIKTEVILDTLLKHLEAPYQLLLVQDPLLLEAQGVNVARLQATQADPLPSVGQVEAVAEGEWLLQPRKDGRPIRVTYRGTEAINPLLTQAAEGMNLLEPFERVEKALEALLAEC